MKSKVHFSAFCTIMTAVCIALFLSGIIVTRHQTDKCILMTAITVIAVFTGLYYCPVSVRVGLDSIKIHRLLSGDKTFRYSDMEAVDTCYPSAGGIRLCGSGGFFGYWGYFSDIIIGQYFGYYADRSQCFCIRLKNKRQYVVSCEQHIDVVKAIQKKLE